MIKYEVVKDSRIEIIHYGAIPHYTTKELLDFADNRSGWYYDTLASTESKEEAQKIFGAEKNIVGHKNFKEMGV